jgi:hypothetical protein
MPHTRTAAAPGLGRGWRLAGRLIRIVIGVLMLAIGTWIFVGAARTRAAYGSAAELIEQAASRDLPRVNAGEAAPSDYEGQLILLRGPLRLAPITDPLTGVTVAAGALQRAVEMYQWEERTRFGSGGRADDIEYYYVKDWSDELVDSDQFSLLSSFGRYKNPKEMPIEALTLTSASIRLDDWPLATDYALYVANELARVTDPRPSDEEDANWQAIGGYLYPSRAATVEVGTVRLRYEELPASAETYSAIGVVRDGVVRHEELFPEGQAGDAPIAPGAASVGELIAPLRDGSTSRPGSSGYVWIGLGILLCLRPLALLLHVAPGFANASFPRRLLMTLVVAIGVAALTGISIT